MFVLDRSVDDLEVAKETVLAAVDALDAVSPYDIVAVIAFDEEAQVFVRPTRATSRVRISNDVSTLQSGRGKQLAAGLIEAHQMLASLNAKHKVIVLLTDGMAPGHGLDGVLSMLEDAHVPVWAVGMRGADRNLLALITDQTNGRLYLFDAPSGQRGVVDGLRSALRRAYRTR